MNAFAGNRRFKVKLCFTTLKGAKIMMPFDCEETIDGVLTKFLKRVNLTDLIGNLQNKLKFIMSAESINFGDFRLMARYNIMYVIGIAHISVANP